MKEYYFLGGWLVSYSGQFQERVRLSLDFSFERVEFYFFGVVKVSLVLIDC